MDGERRDSDGIEPTSGFQIRGAAERAKARRSAPDTCTICLEAIRERAVAVPCNHLTFDFLCLVSWLQEKNTCPLCKATVKEVQYDFRSPSDYKSHRVPEKEEARKAPTTRQALRRRPFGHLHAPPPPVVYSPALERRRMVYRHKLYSKHVGSNSISGYRDTTAQALATSTELQSRAKKFLQRELQVFTFLDSDTPFRSRDFLVEYIIAVLKVNELQGAGGEAEDLVQEFLGRENTRLLLHELGAWLRSPFPTLSAWDEHVQYASPPDQLGGAKNGSR